MKTLILDGSHTNDALGKRISTALQTNLGARGWASETIVLREQKIGNCAGDFLCWTRNPGVCNVDDDNRKIAEKLIHTDLLIYLSPVTFGATSSALKRMMDHQIQNLSPFFTTINGETHHQKRYGVYPRVLTIGWLESPYADAESIFRHLAFRNSINMHATTNVCGITYETQSDSELNDALEQYLTQIERSHRDPEPALPT